MILCLGCKRLWKSGAKYCGICNATLGGRRCPEDHENPLWSRCCSTCGSQKLTQGVAVIQFRPLVTLVLLFGFYKLIPSALALLHLHDHFESIYWFSINEVLSRLIIYTLLVFFFAWLFGPKTLNVVRDFGIGSLRILSKLILAIGKVIVQVLIKLILRGPPIGGKK